MKKLLAIVILFFLHSNLLAVQIRYAKDSSNRIVDAQTVPKINGPFFCVECQNQLILRRGEILQPHFAHSVDSPTACTGGAPETWEHILAKQLLAENLDKWQFISPCLDCFVPTDLTNFPANQGFESHIEYPFHRFVVDVMIRQQKEVVAALEVRQSHAVDDEKYNFFKEKGVKILEVNASDVLKGFNSKKFEITCIKRERCTTCEDKNKRQCIACKNWYAKENLCLLSHPDWDFACFSCTAYCPTCNEITTRQQIAQCHFCHSCSSSVESWERQSEKAINEEDLSQIRKLLKDAPAMINTSFLDEKYEEIKQVLRKRARQKEEEEQQAKEQEELARLEQWKNDAHNAIEKIDIKNIRILLRNLPIKIDEESEVMCRQLMEEEVIFEKYLQQKAQEVFEKKSVLLNVPPSDREKVDRYYPEWNSDNTCRVVLSHIEECSPWLAEPEIVPHVLKLLEQERIDFKKSQRARDALERKNPPSKKTRNIGAFFKKKNDPS